MSAYAEPQAAPDGAAFCFGVPGTMALGFLMYSANVASSQVRPEFLLTGSGYSPPRIPSAVGDAVQVGPTHLGVLADLVAGLANGKDFFARGGILSPDCGRAEGQDNRHEKGEAHHKHWPLHAQKAKRKKVQIRRLIPRGLA